MVEHALNGSYHFARKINYKILPLMETNFIESSPAPCKFVMKEMGLCEENLRLPLVPVTASSRAILKAVMKDLGMKESDIETAVDFVGASPIANPRPVARADLVELITQAFHGERPRF